MLDKTIALAIKRRICSKGVACPKFFSHPSIVFSAPSFISLPDVFVNLILVFCIFPHICATQCFSSVPGVCMHEWGLSPQICTSVSSFDLSWNIRSLNDFLIFCRPSRSHLKQLGEVYLFASLRWAIGKIRIPSEKIVTFWELLYWLLLPYSVWKSWFSGATWICKE